MPFFLPQTLGGDLQVNQTLKQKHEAKDATVVNRKGCAQLQDARCDGLI